MSKPSRTTFRERLTDFTNRLREEIIAGKREPGQYLPSEAALSEQFQLSKSSIRKGLDTLVEEGLIEKVARIGNRIVQKVEEPAVILNLGYYSSLEKESMILQLVERFHAKYPHIRVKLIPLPYDEEHQTVKVFLQQGLIDVVTLNYSDFSSLNETGEQFFEPLTANPGIYPHLTETFTASGELFVQPFIFSPVVLCYNKDHFAEAGCLEPDSSWSWEQLVETASKLTSPSKERYGFCFHALSENRWPVFLLQSGIQLNRDKAVELHSGDKIKIMESVNVFRSIISDKNVFPFYLSENDADVENLFLNENVSMIMTSYFSLNYLSDAPFRYDISPLPRIHDPKTLLLIIGLAINKRSRCKHEARLLVEHMVSMDSQLAIRQGTLSIPSLKPAAEWSGEEHGNRPSRYHMYREIVPTYHLFTDIGLDSEGMASFRHALKLYLAKMEEQKFYDRIDMIL
ncbi:extracellular solute-binding protein [Paenibacillus sp. J5C_2022]|uniref:extracellular solute-binding protein n=1 Tax=Paenibacillus sp. J5C2022 TaxID=2977129 RepID=UPI0021D1EA6E|nr:extracellular solute-binding protein [Paenibacillus sp. J5C2022]MCU6710665.1 extracellular solute-binding protein [Paenibacillus sp. J5C2022]